MMNTDMPDKTHELVRDLFIFSTFTGLAYSDVKNLTEDNLQTFFDGNLWIITRRKKTNTESNIRLLDVPLRLWDVKNNRASGKSVEAQRINIAVDKIRVEVNRRYQELMQTDGYVTAAKLKDAYLGIGVKQETLLKLFEQHNTEFSKKVGHSRAKGTFQRYVTVCKHIREFLSHTYKREDIPLK